MYYYNDDVFKSAVSCASGFEIKQIDGSGIVLSGEVPEGCDMLVTLPSEGGYRVYVDGVKTPYCSYRNTLMLIGAEAGKHEIVIKYTPPGFEIGILISVLSSLIFILGLYISNKRKTH